MEDEGGLFGVVGLAAFWMRPVSGWERGSLDRAWEDEEAMGSVEEEMGSVDVDRSLSEDLELWWWRREEEEWAGSVLLL